MSGVHGSYSTALTGRAVFGGSAFVTRSLSVRGARQGLRA